MDGEAPGASPVKAAAAAAQRQAPLANGSAANGVATNGAAAAT